MIGIDGGPKAKFVTSLGARHYFDFTTPDVTPQILSLTSGGAAAVIVAAGHVNAFSKAAEMLKVGGTLSCIGIPPERGFVETPISTIVIKGLHITGNLVGSLKECLEAVEFVRRGVVKPVVTVRRFEELPHVYEELERGKITGRVVLKIAKDE